MWELDRVDSAISFSLFLGQIRHGMVILFGWVLCHINRCGLFNDKSSWYTYTKYIWFGLVGFHGISTIVGHLMPNSLYIHILDIYNLVWLGFMAVLCDLGLNRGLLQTFFVWVFKIVVDSWKFSMLLLYILWDDRPIFMISGSNEQLQQELEYTLLKPDCHCWWISKIQSDTLKERYAIKLCFKHGKNHRNVWNASDWFSTILHESSISFWVA